MTSPQSQQTSWVWLPTVATFFSAFLLFLIQPLATKSILPELGGSPFVWGTAMVFFQFTLLLGYLFSFLILKCKTFVVQAVGYILIALCGLLFLPLSVAIHTHTDASLHPVWWIVVSFSISLAVPFFLLSTTNTLAQGWFARTHHPHAHNPYFLYAASNAGSLLALLLFPLVFEPLFDLDQIKKIWSVGFLIFVCMMIISLIMMQKQNAKNAPNPAQTPQEKLSLESRAYWIFLAFIPSSLFISVTTFVTTDIAAAPLLWIIPLALYLITFIIAFSSIPERITKQHLKGIGFSLLILLVISINMPLAAHISMLHFALMFGVALWSHLLLSRSKPDPAYLGEYYLWISVGGVLGGIFASLLSPLWFNGPWEYGITLILASFLKPNTKEVATNDARLREDYLYPAMACLVAITIVWLSHMAIKNDYPPLPAMNAWFLQHAPLLNINTLRVILWIGLGFALLLRFHRRRDSFVMVVSTLFLLPAALSHYNSEGEMLHQSRSFFGISKVIFDREKNANLYRHGSTVHGLQARDEAHRLSVVSYYAPLIEILAFSPPQLNTLPIALGGLGTGTIFCLTKNTHFDAIEIDPAVIEIAKNPDYFTYLRDCPSTHTLILGDARKRIAEQPDGKYRMIIMDAFTSDAIPIHLLTKEAVETYQSKIVKDGILAFNISNRFFELRDLFGALGEALGMEAYYKGFEAPKDDPYSYSSKWVFMTNPLPPEKRTAIMEKGWTKLSGSNARVWTDRYSNILQFLM